MNPSVNVGAFAALMECITTCDELQYMVMRPLVYQIVKRSMTSFTHSGLENLEKGKPYLFVSNHRDITLDASLLDVVLLSNGFTTPEIGFGNNLMQNEFMVDLFRLNKMFTIIRDGSRREFYNNSVFLSHYISHVLHEKKSSVWIAQRNGRTKDGDDRTDQGLLKMFSMAGTGDFEKDFVNMNIVPVAISYEYEPCDTMKAIATYTSLTGIYEKSRHEDVLSIVSGISQPKGDVHIHFCEPVSQEEIAQCASYNKNERFSALAHLMDKRIHNGYKLHPTNYIAADLLNSSARFEEHYSTEQMEKFIDYVERASYKGPSMAAESKLTEIFLSLYAKPVENQLG
jgi:glycerol-3-phosphate O-acyltransferase